MAQSWQRLQVAHWPVDPGQVARLVPAGLDLDIYSGAASDEPRSPARGVFGRQPVGIP